MNNVKKNESSVFELAKLYVDRGDFNLGEEKLLQASEDFLNEKDFDSYLKCQNILLRIYAETESQDKITKTKENLQDLVIQEGFELNARSFYTLGICASYKKQYKTALEYFEKSLKLALEKDEKEDICYAINGFAIVYWLLGRNEDALKELYNLQVFFQILDMPELRMSTLLLNGHILRKMGKYEQALEVFWQAYDILKTQKNLYMHVSLLYAMGVTHADLGEYSVAKMYLNLAKKATDPDNLKYLAGKIDKRLEELGDVENNTYDLVLENNANFVTERKKGRVNFKSQFILLDLLRLFMNNPGEIYSKESLVRKVWKQEYDPSVHDNKVYVTIKRLRKLIEPDYDKPKYIFRSKNGYYLNKAAKVYINH